MFGAVDAMEGIVRRIRISLGSDSKVIATGGYARVIAEKTKVIDHIEPALVLEGLRIIYESNRKETRSRK